MNILDAINENPTPFCFLVAALLIAGGFIFGAFQEDDEY